MQVFNDVAVQEICLIFAFSTKLYLLYLFGISAINKLHHRIFSSGQNVQKLSTLKSLRVRHRGRGTRRLPRRARRISVRTSGMLPRVRGRREPRQIAGPVNTRIKSIKHSSYFTIIILELPLTSTTFAGESLAMRNSAQASRTRDNWR